MIRVESNTVWQVLRIYEVGGKLLKAAQTQYEHAMAVLRVNGILRVVLS